ncbi:hypothetical protein ACLOJK_031686 [Asimina triloba]
MCCEEVKTRAIYREIREGAPSHPAFLCGEASRPEALGTAVHVALARWDHHIDRPHAYTCRPRSYLHFSFQLFGAFFRLSERGAESAVAPRVNLVYFFAPFDHSSI